MTSVGPIPQAHASTVLGLPQPGTMVNLSPAYDPVIIKGLTVHKDNPFLFDFIVDVGQDRMSGEPLKREGEKLIKYFLASLAIPDKDLWVNLSPYEKNRMVPEALGQTDMGRDLLEQDYILKQITASLIYPEKQLGRTFWDRVYARAQQMYGTTQVPVDTFNKVWIMADRAEVLEHDQTAFVTGCHLKVMLEEDYLALQKHSSVAGASSVISKRPNTTHALASQIIKEIVLPELEKEINTGKNFANLRQIFNSVILSSWYKKNLKEALLNEVYADKDKVKGIDLNDPTIKEQIYEQYLKAYKKGVFNYIKEDVNTAGDTIPRKYFSGGTIAAVRPTVRELYLYPDVYSRSLPASPGRLVRMNTDFVFHANASMLGNTAITAVNLIRGQRFSGINVERGSWIRGRRVKTLNGPVEQFVAATQDARPGVQKRARRYIEERTQGLEAPYQLFHYLFEKIEKQRIAGKTKIDDLVWPIFIEAWTFYQNNNEFPEIKYAGLEFASRSKEKIEIVPPDTSSVMRTTTTLGMQLEAIAANISLQRVRSVKIDGVLVDFSDPAWKTGRVAAGSRVDYSYFNLTGNPTQDIPVVKEAIDQALGEGRLNDAIRLYTLNYFLIVKDQKELVEDISKKLISAYKGDFRLVGKMGGSEIQWALATPAGIVTPILSQPTYIGPKGEALESQARNPENSLEKIMQRIVNPMKDLIQRVGPGRIRDYYYSAPGFFGPDGKLVEPQQNIANMGKGFWFDGEIPRALNRATNGQVNISGRTVHDGTGHAFGDKSAYGPFSLEDTIYGFWVGTGIASRVSPRGLVAFTGGQELNYLHNEGSHNAVWNPQTGRYEIVFDTTKGFHPDFKSPGSSLYGREDLEDRTSGKAMGNALRAEYERILKQGAADQHYQEAVEITELLGKIGKTKLDLAGERYLAKNDSKLMRRVFQQRSKELGLGIGALLWYLTTHQWADGSTFDLTTIKIPVGGAIVQLNALGLFEQVKAGILDELNQDGVPARDLELISNNIVMSPVDDDMRELLGGLPEKEFEKGNSAMTTITDENYPILAPSINTSGNVAESSLKERLTSKYGLTTGGDNFKSIVMGASNGKTDIELARQIIKAVQIDPKKDWAKDQWFALRLFVAMRYILYQEFNTSAGEQYIPNGPVESVIIDYLGADVDHRDIAAFAQKIADAYQLDPTYRNAKIDWSAYLNSFEAFLEAAQTLYNGLKDAYSEALVEHAKELALIQNAPKPNNGGAPKQVIGVSTVAAAGKASSAASAPTQAVPNGKFTADPSKDFHANLEALSYYAKGPFYPLSPDVVNLIWPKVVEPEGTKSGPGMEKRDRTKAACREEGLLQGCFCSCPCTLSSGRKGIDTQGR